MWRKEQKERMKILLGFFPKTLIQFLIEIESKNSYITNRLRVYTIFSDTSGKYETLELNECLDKWIAEKKDQNRK
jgi:hypothetical protein